MPKFSCWQLYEEGFTGEWANPERTIIADNVEHAVQQYGDGSFDDEVAVLVRNDTTGELYEIEAHKEWTLDMYKKVTAEEMKPNG